MRAVLDRCVALLARLMLRVFFRSIEVSGASRIPRGVPLLIVANHVNSIVDPLLLMAFVNARTRVLAKSTLWRHPVLGPLLVLAGALPVFRRRDAGEDVTKNFTTFARCHDELARGGSIALFPEGTSHNLPHRLPLKTGAARIALETEARNNSTGLRILPVGVVYEAKDRFRSRVLINVGEPIDPGPEALSDAVGRSRAVRALTERIASGLEAVTTSYETWGQARLLGLAAAVAGDASLAERFVRSRAFLAAYHELRERDPRRVARLVQSLEDYEGRLRTLALVDEDVVAASRSGQAWRELLLNLPVGALGSVLNILPYRLTGWVTRHFARTPDEPASYMLLTALLVFPASWLVIGLIGTLAAGPLGGLAAASLAPLTGCAALRLREALRILGQPRPAARLAREREALARQIQELAARTA